jgi:arylsulfatase A-like enzyme
LTYLHFFPPHEPYRPTRAFYRHFNDGWRPPRKPNHPLASEKASYMTTRNGRQFYDEYLASWDAETGRLFDYLRDSGLLERSYVIITSDHGEIFERGEMGHFTPLMYDPVMHSPLIISTPPPRGWGCRWTQGYLHPDKRRGPFANTRPFDGQLNSKLG